MASSRRAPSKTAGRINPEGKEGRHDVKETSGRPCLPYTRSTNESHPFLSSAESRLNERIPLTAYAPCRSPGHYHLLEMYRVDYPCPPEGPEPEIRQAGALLILHSGETIRPHGNVDAQLRTEHRLPRPSSIP